MDGITHLLVGRLLAGAAPSPALGWIATLYAVLPDFDTITWFVPPLRRYMRHRGFTHTLPFGLVASVTGAIICALAGWAPFGLALVFALLGFASHVTLDVLNWGAPVLWPWRGRALEWTVHGGFAWSAGLSIVSLGALAALHRWVPSIENKVSAALAVAFAAYLGLRAALKLRALRQNPGAHLLPTGNPLVWVVAEAA